MRLLVPPVREVFSPKGFLREKTARIKEKTASYLPGCPVGRTFPLDEVAAWGFRRSGVLFTESGTGRL